MSFADSDIVRSAIQVEGFRDAEFNYQLIRAMGVADYGGSTVGECLAVAAEIADGSPQSWARAFDGLAQRVEASARTCLAAGHPVSGRDHLLRASTYYRTAEYYADRSSERSAVGQRSQVCFAEAGALLSPPVTAIDIPFQGAQLPGYLVPPTVPPRGSAPPTLICVGGFDSSAEELYFHYGAPGSERGWQVVTFDGPGQPGAMRSSPELTFRPDYEVPIAAVLDAVLDRDDVDPARVAVVGQSFGSYFAARSAAVDRRVQALVVNPPMTDMGRYIEVWMGPEVFGMTRDIRPEDVTGVPEDLMPHQMQWGIEAICRRFGAPSFAVWRESLAEYRLGPALGSITCPVLALVGEREGDEPAAQYRAFLAGVGGAVTGRQFTVGEGASTHCQADNIRLSAQVTFDWLDEQFA
jgi:pimeloyl-ACP methyl ester carboxylesterase